MNDLTIFTRPIDRVLEDFADRQRNRVTLAGLIPGSIDDTYLGTQPYDDIPCSIYFYYVRVNSNGRVFVTHHFYPLADPDDPNVPANPADWPAIDRDPNQLTPILEMLAREARPSGTNKYKIGKGFENITWRRKSYIAFFIDEADWTVKPKDGVTFVTDPKGGVAGTPNHTFFDALYLPLTMPIRRPSPNGPTTDQRSALIFVNHMKADATGRDIGRDAQGNPLPIPPPAERQLFHFLIVFDVAIEGGNNKMTVIFDPDGSNQGPPIGPP